MKFYLKKYWPYLLLILISIIFFWKFFFKGLIPFPGDMLVGAYYPWLDHKWGGFVTSVPIKNPLISDVFSQFYLWKQIIINSIKNLSFPFWNIYSYSGYPLYANFHSGSLNPFNLLLLVFGNQTGWSFFVISQFFFSSITFYLFLKQLYPKKKLPCLAGSIVYSYSGFMVTWSQFVTAGFAMVWLPLVFLNIEKFFETKRYKYLIYIPILYFLIMTSGHLQALAYSYIISGLYFVYKLLQNKKIDKKKIINFSLVIVLSFFLMTVQLLPTIEMGKNSVRFNENYISGYNFGLLSLDRIITLFAPDYFGNPTTFNYWGSFNYHETVIYCGILPIFALIYCLFNFKKLKHEKFFLITCIISLLFTFNTFLGKSIYYLKLPLLSTSAAGRINMIFVFCVSVLTAYFFDQISLHKFKNTLRFYWGYIAFVFIIALYTLIMYKLISIYPDLQQKYYIGLRNLVLPVSIIGLIFIVLAFIKNTRLKSILILFIIILDLFRFSWKYTPFVNKEYFYPQTEITNFLQNQKGLFRIEKEKGPLMTPNIWTAYNLSSPAGYDPMSLDSYSRFYKEYLNNEKNIINTSRYSEIDNYDAEKLGEANVKYLLALKYDSIDKISSDGNHLNYKINLKDWTKIYEYGSVVVLENTKFKPRIEINNPEDQKTISNINYSANQVSFNIISSKDNQNIILRDTWYPGWKAYVDNQETNIDKYLDIYRNIKVDKGNHFIKFVYKPYSFYLGLKISLFSAIIWLILLIKYKTKTIDEK